MPIHDWARAPAGAFREFHTIWNVGLRHRLNAGVLPPGYFAKVERHTAGFIPDILTLELPQGAATPSGAGAPRLAPPRLAPAATVRRPPRRTDRAVAVRAEGGALVAVIEVVSAGNGSSRRRIEDFVSKAVSFLQSGVHLAVLDLWRPHLLTATGFHDRIWRRVGGQEYLPPWERPLTFSSFDAGDPDDLTAYVVPAAVGDCFPALPLFLRPGLCIELPLEETYNAAFAELEPHEQDVLARTLPPATPGRVP